MLAKILVVLVGLIMSLVGALTPANMLAAQKPTDALNADASASSVDQTLATVDANGKAFSSLSVLWIQAEGQRVTDDAWGTGQLKELTFEVGVKGVDGMALAVGDKSIPLHPTDVVTIRMFDGDFAYRGMGTSAQTLQLQGTVKTTMLDAGAPTGRLTTATAGVPLSSTDAHRTGDVQHVAYVTLGTGASVDTVDVTNGGNRLVTADDGSGSAPAGQAGNLLVRWVKIEGKAVNEYTWGDGELGRIEFQPATADPAQTLLQFDNSATTAPRDAHVLVQDFVGQYLVYQVTGGLLRLRLDGYAANITTGAQGGAPVDPSLGLPLPAFEFQPQPAKTTDTLQFRDHTTADGIITFWRWDFGDGTTSVLQDPSHKYARPGVYAVTLNVTDDSLHSVETTRTVVVNNAPPVPAFDYAPGVVSSDVLVSFTDHSLDPDGYVVNWTWSFGDGTVSYERNPNHQFVRSGTLPVTLTVTDDLGAATSLSKMVLVRNSPPIASFSWSPQSFKAGEPVTFHSTSVDHDGTVEGNMWSFGDGSFANGTDVTHTYALAGVYPVTLTSTDNMGAPSTASISLPTIDQPPVASFVYTPVSPIHAGDVVTFNGQGSSDPDGFIVYQEWTWGDGTDTNLSTLEAKCLDLPGVPNPLLLPGSDCQGQLRVTLNDDPMGIPGGSGSFNLLGSGAPGGYTPPPIVNHTYANYGDYNVGLCVTDNFLVSNCTYQIVHVVEHGAEASINVKGPFIRNSAIQITDVSPDLDREGHVITSWVLDNVILNTTQGVLTEVYPTLGSHTVTLNIAEPDGDSASATTNFSVSNEPPVINNLTADTLTPAANVTDNMSVNATDPDGDYPLNITWVFNDGPTFYGPNVSRAFPFTGTFSVAVTVKDALGLAAGPDTLTFNVRVAPPVPDFTWSPPIPETNQTVQFNDTTQAGSTPITKWVWDFGDGSSTTVTTPGQQNVTHVYARPPQVGNNGFTVTLTVSSLGNPDVSVQHNVPVNSPPVANFFYTPTSPNVGDTVTFNDTSSDPDGEPITMRHWDFGDNTSADTTDPTITHRYTGPGAMGTHYVNLTATDARGASASIVKSIYVSDLAPTADFTINPLTPPHANSPIQFLDRSTSPNGNDTISFWDWNFGDNTTLVGTDPAVDQNPFHTYAASGIYSVTLIVGDGNLNSTPTTHTIRVTADHPMQFEINATLPSGVCVNVNDPNIDYEPRLNTNSPVVGLGVKANVSLGKAQFAASACGGNFTLQAGVWAGGDGATVELDVYPPGYPAISLALNYVMSDSMGGSPVVASFTVPLPLVPTIEALPNNDSGLIVPHGPGYDNGTVYHDLITPFHGDGTVHYLDGSPAPGATVTVQLRYVPLYLPGSHTTLRDQLNLPNTPILGWCDADTETTAANGTYTWQVTQSNCLLQPTLSLPGHWEARAVVSAPLEATEISKPCEIFEDPTGLLATIYLP